MPQPAALTRRITQVQVEHVAAAEARGNAAVSDAEALTVAQLDCAAGMIGDAPAPHAVGRLVARVVAGAGVRDLHHNGLAAGVAAGGGAASEAAVVQPAGGAVHAHDLVALAALILRARRRGSVSCAHRRRSAARAAHRVARAGAGGRRHKLGPVDLHHAAAGVQRAADGVAAAVVRGSATCASMPVSVAIDCSPQMWATRRRGSAEPVVLTHAGWCRARAHGAAPLLRGSQPLRCDAERRHAPCPPLRRSNGLPDRFGARPFAV